MDLGQNQERIIGNHPCSDGAGELRIPSGNGRNVRGYNLSEMSESKLSRTVMVINPQGLHARPADLIVKAASRFQSAIEIVKGHERVDAKSILGIFTLAALPGTELIVEAVGPDAADAVDALCELFERGFDELEEKSQYN